MRHQPTDRREVSGRSNRQATWSAVATVMIAGTSVALAQSATPAQPPVNTGLSNLPMLPPTPKQATGGGASQNRNFTPPTPSEPPAGEPMYDAQAAGEPGNEPAPGDVKVDDNLIVDLHLNNEDLSKVLEMLSIQSQRNIVASGGISNAKVSANLYGVTFYEALDAILHPNGYGYIDRGNMIYVHTLEELKQIEQASRVRVSKLVTLSYLNAIDAAEFVKPLLSEGGSIKTPGKTKDFSIPGETPTGADEYALDATLVVYDYEENVAEIEKLLKGLDTKPAQVLVEATIVQTALNENNAFGVDFSLIADMNFADFSGIGGPLKAVDSMISGKGGQLTGGSSVPLQVPADDEGRGLVSTPGNTAGPGTLKLGIVDKDVAVFVKMLDEVSDTTILSNPKILAVNRQPSRVLVGRKVGYLSTTSTDTTTTQTVEFLDTGTQLYFRPFVSLNDNMIRMELKPQVSEAVIRDATDVTGAAVTIPDEITNELVTNVMVKDGQTIVLGGLFRESTQSSRKQVPFLGDIPLIGTAFRGHEDEVQRSEIIFLITPSIVKDELLDRHGKAAKDYIDHARTGSREGLLPWSRDKMTGMKLIEAQKLAAAGDTEKARWKLQQSLSLNQNQPDAIGLLKELGGDVTTWSSRSLMEDIINNEVKTELKTSKFEYDPNHWPTPENHNGSHGVNHSAYQGEPVPPQTNATDDSASVTFTPGDAPSSQPTTEPAVDLVPTTTDGTDPNTDGFATPDSSIQPNTGSQTEPTPTDANFDNSTQPQADPQTEPTPEPTPASNEFVPPTPNETPSDTTNQTTPATPESDTTDQGVNTTGSSTSYDSGSIAGSTTPETATNSHTDTTTSTNTTNTTDSGATTNTDTAIAGTQAERQVAPTDASNTNTATSVAESSTTSFTPVNTDSGATPTPDQAPDPTPGQTSDAASNATPSSTDSSPANTTESSPTSNTTNSTTAPTNNTNNTDTTGASSPTESAATEPTANSTTPSSDAAGTMPTEASNSTNPSNTDATTDNTNTNTTTSASTDTTPTDYANQPNSGFEASESTTSQTANASTAGATNEASAGVVHGEKSNLDLLTNAINTQGGNQASTSENAENSPMSENSSSQNADNNTAAGSASDAQSTSQTQSQTTSKASAASKSKSKTGKEATTKELKPGKSDAATSKTTANSKTAKANTKANTKDSKAAKTKAAQEAKKKKSSWGIFDFLRPSDDDEKPETTVTKGQDDTGPPGEQK
ncbi:MAG: hypothetical protein HUU19_00905 [Phycisphaerales bacterium]|nr:hypothetical protein [Phycisphaerales bacterium]